MADDEKTEDEKTDPNAEALAELEALRKEKADRAAAEAEKEKADREAERAELEALRKEKADREAAEAKRVKAPAKKTEKEGTPSGGGDAQPPAKKRARVSARWFGDAAYDD